MIALSAVIAVVVSVVALWLATTVKTRAQQLAAAVVMGVTVCGMHYTGMSAGTMVCTAPTYAPSLFAIERDSIGYAVFGLTLITLLVILVVEATAPALPPPPPGRAAWPERRGPVLAHSALPGRDGCRTFHPACSGPGGSAHCMIAAVAVSLRFR